MVKKWITFSDLCIFWNIQKRDLADIVNNGKLQAVFENDASVLHIVDGGSFVESQYPDSQMSIIRPEPLAVDELTNLVFRISDVKEYEKKNGISPNWEQKYRELEQNTFENCFDDAIKLSEQDEEIRQLKQRISCQESPKEESSQILPADKVTYENAFIRKEDFWEIWFHGKKLEPIKKLDGLTYIANLLSYPKQIIPVTTLCDSVNPQKKNQAMMGEDDMMDSLNSGNISISTMRYDGLDDKAKENLRTKIKELQETKLDCNLPESERQRANQEYEVIIQTLGNQYGKGALTRRAPKKLNEGVKKELDRVLKAIKRAHEIINKRSPELYEYLIENVEFGIQCEFKDIESRIHWHISI